MIITFFGFNSNRKTGHGDKLYKNFTLRQCDTHILAFGNVTPTYSLRKCFEGKIVKDL